MVFQHLLTERVYFAGENVSPPRPLCRDVKPADSGKETAVCHVRIVFVVPGGG